ncbi:MAG: hypothetical protein FWH52_07315 [Synergistaceae bacterium]|nr:hypothetical protein [Synergistaceae bacterium]
MKRLLAVCMVSYSEYVEKGVNKKRYSITDKGRQALMAWLQTPADMTGSKNIELGKLLFMGLVPVKKRMELIDEIILNTEAELSNMQGLWNALQSQRDNIKHQTADEWSGDPEYLDGILNATKNADALESAKVIEEFEMYALRYGIDVMQFNLGWFQSLKEKIGEKKQ